MPITSYTVHSLAVLWERDGRWQSVDAGMLVNPGLAGRAVQSGESVGLDRAKDSVCNRHGRIGVAVSTPRLFS